MKPVVAFVVMATLWAGSAMAQSMSPNSVFGRYQQAHWQERDGLPQNTILAITTTREGNLWLGTYEGAARFDGVRFTLFNPGNTTGLGNALVYSIIERRNGELWFATYGGGVSRFADGRFTQLTMREGLSSDCSSTHNTEEIRAWLQAQPRIHVHYTPTSASWLNQIEGFFGILAKQSLSITDVASTRALQEHLVAYLRAWNKNPTPFEWTKPARAIIKSHKRMLDRISTAVH